MFETKSGICDLYDTSRMKREFHVRFCERLGLKCPYLLDFEALALQRWQLVPM